MQKDNLLWDTSDNVDLGKIEVTENIFPPKGFRSKSKSRYVINNK